MPANRAEGPEHRLHDVVTELGEFHGALVDLYDSLEELTPDRRASRLLEVLRRLAQVQARRVDTLLDDPPPALEAPAPARPVPDLWSKVRSARPRVGMDLPEVVALAGALHRALGEGYRDLRREVPEGGLHDALHALERAELGRSAAISPHP